MCEFKEYRGVGNQRRLGHTFQSLEDTYKFLDELTYPGRIHLDRIRSHNKKSYTEYRIKFKDCKKTSIYLNWLHTNARAPKVMRVEDKSPSANGQTVLLHRGGSTESLFAWLGALGVEGRSDVVVTEVRIRTQGDPDTKTYMGYQDPE
jgi:hypothetical protein